MKKLLSLILAVSMLLCLGACGGSKDSEETGNAGNDNGGSAMTDPEVDFGDLIGDVKEPVMDFEELVVVDNEECTIKITGIDPDNMWGYTLNAYLENKSADKTYMFSVDGASINGLEADPFFAAEIAPGKKSNEEISFMDDELEDILGLFTDIVLHFRVYDSDDWMADPVAETTVHVYPYGEDKATVFSREAQETDTLIVDNDKVFATVIGYEYDEIWGYTANLYLINRTDTTVMFSADDVSVNGYMCDPFFATTVGAGNCAFASISWSDESFAECGITQVEEIELTLTAYDSEDFMADDFANETVTLIP